MVVLEHQISKGNYQTDSSETKTLYYLYHSPLNFSSTHYFKNQLNYFQLCLDESHES